jgi:hypothetical protein
MDIINRPPVVINLDDDNEIAKIDKEVHNELNLLILFFMSLNDNNHDDPHHKSDSPHVELGDDPSITLVACPLDIYPPSTYIEQDWDAYDSL